MQPILDWIAGLDPWLGYLVLAAAALIEYVFPPFPGDSITLLGAVLIDSVGWSLPLVLGMVTVGSVLGAWIDFEAGRWMAGAGASADTWLHRKLRDPRIEPRVAALCARFTRHGAVYIALNRFLPGIRAFFFVVAGMAGLRRAPVLLWAAVSALGWNLLIVGVGYAIGFNLEALIGWVGSYTRAVYALLAAATVVLAWRWWRARGTHGEGGPEIGDKNLPGP